MKPLGLFTGMGRMGDLRGTNPVNVCVPHEWALRTNSPPFNCTPLPHLLYPQRDESILIIALPWPFDQIMQHLLQCLNTLFTLYKWWYLPLPLTTQDNARHALMDPLIIYLVLSKLIEYTCASYTRVATCVDHHLAWISAVKQQTIRKKNLIVSSLISVFLIVLSVN